MIKQISTATSGTVTAIDTKQNLQLIHNAASLAITLTISFPVTPTDGQTFSVVSVLGVTTLTLSSALTILGGITTLAVTGFATYMYESSLNQWFRIS